MAAGLRRRTIKKLIQIREVTHGTRYLSQPKAIVYEVGILVCDRVHKLKCEDCDNGHSYVNKGLT
jgi:hypothetical protein